MTKGMNWWRNSRQLSIRHRGSVSLADEREWLGNDRAARWLNRYQAQRPARVRPQRLATAPSSPSDRNGPTASLRSSQ